MSLRQVDRQAYGLHLSSETSDFACWPTYLSSREGNIFGFQWRWIRGGDWLYIGSWTKRFKKRALSHSFPRKNFGFLQEKVVATKEEPMDANFVRPQKANEEDKEEKESALAAVEAKELLQKLKININRIGTTPTSMEKAAKAEEKVKANGIVKKVRTMTPWKEVSWAKAQVRTKVMHMLPQGSQASNKPASAHVNTAGEDWSEWNDSNNSQQVLWYLVVMYSARGRLVQQSELRSKPFRAWMDRSDRSGPASGWERNRWDAFHRRLLFWPLQQRPFVQQFSSTFRWLLVAQRTAICFIWTTTTVVIKLFCVKTLISVGIRPLWFLTLAALVLWVPCMQSTDLFAHVRNTLTQILFISSKSLLGVVFHLQTDNSPVCVRDWWSFSKMMMPQQVGSLLQSTFSTKEMFRFCFQLLRWGIFGWTLIILPCRWLRDMFTVWNEMVSITCEYFRP